MKNNLKELLETAFENYKRLTLKEGAINQLDQCTATDVMGYGTTIDEIIHDLTGMKELARLQRQQTEGPNFNYTSTPVFRKIMEHGKSAICVDEIQLDFLFDEQPLSFGIRLSVIMEMINGQWKAVHFHASKPEYDSGGNDPWHREEWNQKMQELQQKVEEKTAELLNQNRELEIEAALERVRSVAMSMQNPDDLLEVCRIISEQLEKLNVENIRNVQVAIIDESRKNYANYQFFAAYREKAFEETGYENNPASQALVTEMQKSANSFFIGSIKDKELEEFRDWRKKYDQFPDPLLQGHAAVYYYFYSIGQGGLGLTTYEEISNASLEIFKRFHKVFTLAYRRFQDIRQALDQAREAEIQLALERVRARTMAMQTSDELPQTASLMAAQLKGLGEEIDQITIGIFKEETNVVEAFGTVKGDQFQTLEVPVDESFVMSNAYKAWKAGKKSMIIELSGEELIGYNKWRNNFFQKNIYPTDNPDKKWFANTAFFSKGLLSFSSDKQVSREANELLERFAAVFNLTYTRFLDLKKAEAQTHEAQIEAALERVRSRSMAMQNSDELADLSFELVRQVHTLGINTWFCAFNIYDDDPGSSLEWGSNMQGTYEAYRTPREGIFLRYYQAGQNGETLLINEIGKDECSGHYDYLCSLPGVGEQLLKMKDAGIPFPVSQIDHVAYFKYGYIIFITFEPVPTAHDIFKRFAKVFEQTYTRFLDLTAAEAQARESALELSLERIRSQVTAMQESSELFDIVVNMRNEFVGLGHEADYFWHMRWLPDAYEMSMTSEDGSRIGMVISIPKYVHDNIPGLAEWEKGDEPVFVLPLDADGAWSYIDNMNTHGHYEKVDPNAPTREDIQHIGGLTFIMARTTHGEIGFGLPGYVADPPQESLDTLVRFAGVFDLAYRRFEDLKSAERQNRETKIELALERIRSKVTAMQESAELLDIVVSMRTEFVSLGHEAHYFWYMRYLANTYEKAMTSGDGTRIGMVMTLPRHIHGDIKRVADWEKSEEPTIVFAMDTETAVDYVHKMITLGDFKQVDPQAPTLEDIRDLGGLTFIMARTQYGEIGFSLPGYVPDPSPESLKTLDRFASVFDLAYRRFEDLKSAEARTNEALKQASLDRVRGQVASMRKPEDLQQITPLIWKELTALQVSFFRCGIFIVDEKQKHVRVYLTTPEGNSLASLDLDFEMSELTRNTVQCWRKKEVYQLHWSRKEFIAWTHEMMKLRQIEKPEEYQGAEEPPESLHLHFIPFAQGMLYVGHQEQLEEENIGLVKSLAEAFSFAYARYEDFVVLEEAKENIEKALSDLKATQSQLVHAEKMASLGELTAGIAHEIQNPLNFVNNFSEVSADLIDEMKEEIQNGNTAEVNTILEDLFQNLQKINHHGKRADGIVKGMLQHSRRGSGQKMPTDIRLLADEYLRLSYHGLRARDKSFNAEFRLESAENLPEINVVGQDIGRVFLNLINNAFFAVNEKSKEKMEGYKPEVVVSTSYSPLQGNKGAVEIRVKDNGNGIPENIKDKIFQPFFTTKATGEGTGLGLSMSYDIITKGHGGKLKVESEPGKGTEFIIELPIPGN